MYKWHGCRAGGHGGGTWITSVLVSCLALLLVGPVVSAGPFAPAARESEGRDDNRIYHMFGAYGLNLDGLNEQLVDNGFGYMDGFFFLWGSGGFNEASRVAVGGYVGAGGATSVREANRAYLATGFGLGELGYVWPGDTAHFQLGGMLGVGGSALVLSDSRPDSMDEALLRRHDTYLTQGFVLIGPSVGFRADLSRDTAVHLKAGYLWALNGPWTHFGSSTGLGAGPDMSAPFFMFGVSHRFGRGQGWPRPDDWWRDNYRHNRRRS